MMPTLLKGIAVTSRIASKVNERMPVEPGAVVPHARIL